MSDMLLWAARVAPLLAALFCWRTSRPAALALLAAFAASLLYLVAPLEPLRWVSALVGLVGAWEFADGTRDASTYWHHIAGAHREYPSHVALFGVLQALPRRAWIGLLLFASMASDGAAMLAWVRLGEWVMPVAQIVVCVAIALVARWPQRVRKT